MKTSGPKTDVAAEKAADVAEAAPGESTPAPGVVVNLNVAPGGEAEAGRQINKALAAYYSNTAQGLADHTPGALRAPRLPTGLPLSVISRLQAAYPARAADIDETTKVSGQPFVQRAGGNVLCVHQKYALSDGTILVLEVKDS